MRTTLTIDDQLVKALKALAYSSDKSFKAVVNETLKAGLNIRQADVEPRRYSLKAASLGELRLPVDLNKTLQLANQLEDEELVRKFRMRK